MAFTSHGGGMEDKAAGLVTRAAPSSTAETGDVTPPYVQGRHVRKAVWSIEQLDKILDK